MRRLVKGDCGKPMLEARSSHFPTLHEPRLTNYPLHTATIIKFQKRRKRPKVLVRICGWFLLLSEMLLEVQPPNYFSPPCKGTS